MIAKPIQMELNTESYILLKDTGKYQVIQVPIDFAEGNMPNKYVTIDTRLALFKIDEVGRRSNIARMAYVWHQKRWIQAGTWEITKLIKESKHIDLTGDFGKIKFYKALL